MLDEFGKVAVAEIVFYAPILCVSFFVALRLKREGWAYLFIFSTVRLLGSILSIVSKTQSNPSVGLLVAVGILQSLGLSPLLLATLGFVSNIADYGLPNLQRILHIIRLVLVTGVVLAIIGGTKLSPDNPPSSQASGHTLSKVGSVCFAAAYGILFVIHILLWGAKEDIPAKYRKFLISLSLSLPFLAVRVLYSVIGAFVPSPSQWSSTRGSWRIYLVMALIMEYIVVCIYVITGAVISLHKEEKAGYVVPRARSDDGLEMGNKRYNSPY